MFEHGKFYRHHDYGECCQSGGFHRHHFHRRFISREEKISRLEEYLKDLQAEARAVEEHLAELKKAA